MYTHTRNLGAWECYNPYLTVSVGLSPQSVRLSVDLSVSHSVRLSDNCFCFFCSLSPWLRLGLSDFFSVFVYFSFCQLLSLSLSLSSVLRLSLSLSLSLPLSLSLSLSLFVSLSLSLRLSLSLSLFLCHSLSVFVAVLSFTMLFACLCWSVGRPCLSSRQKTSRSIGVGQPAHPSINLLCLLKCLSVCVCVCLYLGMSVCLSLVASLFACPCMCTCGHVCLFVSLLFWGGQGWRGVEDWAGGGVGCFFVCLIVLCVWCVCVTFVCRFSYGFMFVCAGVCMCGKGMCMCVNKSVYVYIHK